MSWADRDPLRGVIDRVALKETDDSGTQQLVRATGLAGEEFRRALRAEPHGFHSHPPVGSEGVVLLGGARRDRPVIIGLEHKDHCPRDLEAGEAVLYDDKGQVVFLKTNRINIHSQRDVIHIALGPLRFVLAENRYAQVKVKEKNDPEDGGNTLMHITLDKETGVTTMSPMPIAGPDPKPEY